MLAPTDEPPSCEYRALARRLLRATHAQAPVDPQYMSSATPNPYFDADFYNDCMAGVTSAATYTGEDRTTYFTRDRISYCRKAASVPNCEPQPSADTLQWCDQVVRTYPPRGATTTARPGEPYAHPLPHFCRRSWSLIGEAPACDAAHSDRVPANTYEACANDTTGDICRLHVQEDNAKRPIAEVAKNPIEQFTPSNLPEHMKAPMAWRARKDAEEAAQKAEKAARDAQWEAVKQTVGDTVQGFVGAGSTAVGAAADAVAHGVRAAHGMWQGGSSQP